MVDTVKIFIPVRDPSVLQHLEGKLQRFRKEDLKTGKVHLEYYRTDLELGSHNRNVMLKSIYNPHGLFVEFSAPKYLKGNNVEMIEPKMLLECIESLSGELKSYLGDDLPHTSTWILYRLDICYNWRFNDHEEARQVMDFIKLIDFPRKKKYTWDTSVMYKGSSYNVKFYLKGDEFRRHDFKKIKAWKSSILEMQADKIVRFEVELRRQQLENFFLKELVQIEDVADNELIEEALQYYLKKVFKYLEPKATENADIIRSLQTQFSKPKATRLYEFYQNYYHNEEIKNLYKNGGLNRSTIYRYKRDLKKAGVGFQKNENQNTAFMKKLVIPQEDVRFDFLNEND